MWLSHRLNGSHISLFCLEVFCSLLHWPFIPTKPHRELQRSSFGKNSCWVQRSNKLFQCCIPVFVAICQVYFSTYGCLRHTLAVLRRETPSAILSTCFYAFSVNLVQIHVNFGWKLDTRTHTSTHIKSDLKLASALVKNQHRISSLICAKSKNSISYRLLLIPSGGFGFGSSIREAGQQVTEETSVLITHSFGNLFILLAIAARMNEFKFNHGGYGKVQMKTWHENINLFKSGKKRSQN